MGTTLMRFSREAGNYVTYVTQEVGDTIEFETTEEPSFPSSTKATHVNVYINAGLKSGSGNYRSTPLAVEFKCNGSWRRVWSGSRELSGDGGDGTVDISSISIPSSYQHDFATYGVKEIRFVQTDSKYAIKGMSTAYGVARFTYEESSSGGDSGSGSGSGGGWEEDVTHCTSPTSVGVQIGESDVILDWEGAEPGKNNPINCYLISYYDCIGPTDRPNAVSPEIVGYYDESPARVPKPPEGVYRYYMVTTIGSDPEYVSYGGTFAPYIYFPITTTRCIAPKTVSVEKTITAAKTNRLSWSGAQGGTNNAISGYFIQYRDGRKDNVWDINWSELKTVGTETSTEVDMPMNGCYRMYKVWTLGAAGSSYRSSDGTLSNITFRGPGGLDDFTDSPLVAGETHVKALHMQELQDRANSMRDFYHLPAYNFTPITDGVTDLKDWTAHVNEVRAAVDEITRDHAAWITISANCPRADVIEQLRAVILSI